MTRTAATAPRPQSREQIAVVARGGLANLVGAVVSAAANFALTVVVARYVSLAAAGVFFAATSVFLMLVTLGRLGADTGAVYFVARWRARNQSSRVRAGLRWAYAPVVAVCVALAVVVLVFAPQIARLVEDTGGGSVGDSVGLLRLFAVLLPVAAAYDIALGATRGFGWMRPTVLVEKLGRPIVQLALVAAVLLAGADGLWLGLAWVLPYLAAFAAAGWLLRSVLPERTVRPEPDDTGGEPGPSVAREFWTFTAPRAAAGVAQIVLQRLDIVLVAALRGPADAAVYTAATRFLVVGQFVNQAISAPVQPALSAALSTNRIERARELYRVSTGWLVLLSWPLFGLAAALAAVYMDVFGPGYDGGTAVVVILALTMLVASSIGLVDSVIVMAGKTNWNLWTTLLAVVVNVGVDLWLIPQIGLVGAAVGWCASILAANLVPLALCWRVLRLHPFGRSTARAYALAGGCWVALPGLTRAAFGANPAALAVSIALAAGLYAFGLWRWRDAFDIGDALRRRVPVAA